jgi:hypothetical protein
MYVDRIGDALDARWAVTVYYAYGRREGLKSTRECRHRHDRSADAGVDTRAGDAARAAAGKDAVSALREPPGENGFRAAGREDDSGGGKRRKRSKVGRSGDGTLSSVRHSASA